MTEKGRYAEYYGDQRLSAWRAVSARDKARNVAALCGGLGNAVAKIADIGCGDGAVITELARLGFGATYAGFEVSVSGLRIARSAAAATTASCFVLFDGVRLPVRDKAFDLAILSHVLEHAECPRALLREAGRIAKYVFVEVPLEYMVRTPSDFRETAVGHINLFNPLLIRHLVQSAGFRVLTQKVTCPGVETFTFQRNPLKGTLHWAVKASVLRLFPALGARMLSYHSCLLAASEESRESS